MALTRDARIEESPYLRRALADADPDRAVLTVDRGTRRLLHHGDPLAEYWALLDGVALVDVSFHRQVEVTGRDALGFVQSIVTRDLSSHEVGQAKYAFMTDVDGGIVCDPVVLRLDDDRFWLSAADEDLHLRLAVLAEAWGGEAVTVSLPDVAPAQLRGPQAAAVMADLFGDELADLGYQRLVRRRLADLDLVVTRTGWGSTDAFEVFVIDARRDGNAGAERWWDTAMRAGERHHIVAAAPSHVRRIESGLLMLGTDLDSSTTPLEVGDGFSWMVDLDQPDDFVGRAALRAQRAAGPGTTLVGVDLDGPDLGAVPDPDIPSVLPAMADGRANASLTSACHSPRLRRNIGYLRVAVGHDRVGAEFAVPHPVHGCLTATVVHKPHLK